MIYQVKLCVRCVRCVGALNSNNNPLLSRFGTYGTGPDTLKQVNSTKISRT